MSLRTRLALSFAVVALIATGLAGAFSFRSTSDELSASIDRFVRERLIDTAAALRAEGGVVGPDPSRRPARGGRIFDGRPVADDDAIIQIRSASGTLVSSGEILPETEAVTDLLDRPGRDGFGRLVYDDVEIDGEPYRMVTASTSGGGAIQVARSAAEIDAVRSALVGRFVVIALLVSVAAAAMGWLVASRVTAPLRRLTSVAADVAGTGSTDGVVVGPDDTSRSDEIGTLASSLGAMLARLDASRERQRRLIHDAGHELRTPLTSLRLNVSMLERADARPGSLDDAERATILAAVRSELSELGDLFDEMIELATEDRRDEFAPSPVDLAGVASSVVARWSARSGRTITLDADPCVVSGDAAMLERAISNLVSNADKFSPDDEPVHVVVGDGVVSVRDAGPGIEAAERELVFERFHRSDAMRSLPGSGLGLSIVARIVELHGGEVRVGESPAGGADVGFRIPPLDTVRDAGRGVAGTAGSSPTA